MEIEAARGATEKETRPASPAGGLLEGDALLHETLAAFEGQIVEQEPQ
jgi:hypothetical protein